MECKIVTFSQWSISEVIAGRAALKVASEQQSIQIERGLTAGPFVVFEERVREEWFGQPGHEIDIVYPRFESATMAAHAKELSDFFIGRAYATLIQHREKPWNQAPDLFAEKSSTATNGRWEGYGIAHATDSLLSLTYDVGWYGAGAAHPNMHFETYTFAYEDRTVQVDLGDFFSDPDLAAKRISEVCIQSLSREYWERTGERPDESQVGWFLRGAGPNLDNFAAFTVGADRFTFLFAPYQVSAYAMGRWAADVSFYDIL